LIFGLALAAFFTYVIINISNAADIEYHGSRPFKVEAFKISGVDMMDNTVKMKHKSLVTEMQYTCSKSSEDVLFSFQFNHKNVMLEDHIFYLCANTIGFGNSMVLRGKGQIHCTEEFNGDLRKIVRHKTVTIKYINIGEWQQMEYTSKNPKESCMIQHAIEILENKWV
jgi:hypothetical protein